MTIAEKIQKTDKTLEERGLPADSYFEVVFQDDSTITEKEANWSAMSLRELAKYFGHKMMFFISNYKIKKITIYMNGLQATIDNIAPDQEVYQFVRSERLLAKDIDRDTIIGRGIGIIKDSVVIEEQFINALENRVEGMKA